MASLLPSRGLFAVALLWVTWNAQAAPVSEKERAGAKKLIQEIMEHPVAYTQMCGAPTLPAEEVSLCGFHRWDGFIAVKDFKRLRDARESVIAVIIQNFEVILQRKEFALNVMVHKMEDDYESQMMMLIDLNGVEALPSMVRLLDAVEEKQGAIQRTPPRKDVYDSVPSQVADLRSAILSTIFAILRQERYEPLLKSEMEGKHKKWIEQNRDDLLKNMTERELKGRIEKGEFDFCRVDPIYNIPCRYFMGNGCTVPLTPELSKTIRSWASDYLAKTPEKQRKGVTGMSPRPIMR